MTELQEAEATTTTVPVTFRGETYDVDVMRMGWDTLDADQRGDHTLVVRTMLGDEQWAKFTATHPQPLVIEDGDLVNIASSMRAAILEALGNLNASSDS